ncbi:hypothetical protein, partial [Photobacterium sanctipauli]
MRDIHEFNAHLELQHIFLEANAERYHSLRQYFEAYYCYSHKLTTRQGKPDWEQIFSFASCSQQAAMIQASKANHRKETVRELRVPLSVLTGKLKTLVRDEQLTLEAVKQLLDSTLEYVVISRAEWQVLKKNGWLEA